MNNDMRVVFVILHYQNVEVTIDSVQYLLKLNGIKNHNIVIVDNASPNGSGDILEKKYANADSVIVLKTDHNGGFAYGNNFGYKYAKKELKADIICVMNSDVFIKNTEFIVELLKYADRNKSVGIVAPDIVIKNGYHQNPYMLSAINTRKQKEIVLKKQIGLVLYSIPILNSILINRKSVRNFEPNKKDKVKERISGIVPHGACLIYMPEWVKKEDKAFVDGTFLFVEEELLFDYCAENGYLVTYEPDFVVFHMEDSSQDAINSSFLQKKRNQMKYEIASRKLLISLRKS